MPLSRSNLAVLSETFSNGLVLLAFAIASSQR